MGTPVSGATFYMQINTGTDVAPTYTTMGGGVSASLNLSMDEIDITCKDSSNWHEALPSMRSWGMDFEALLEEDTTTYTKLIDAWLNGVKWKAQITTPSGKKFTGSCIVSSLTIDGPYDDKASFTGSLKGSGILTYV